MGYYFCYSSALDLASLDQWKQQHGYEAFTLPAGQSARALETRPVADFPSRFWGGRVLGLQPAAGVATPGVVFEISDDKDWHVIRHKEGVVTGACVEIELDVELNGERVRARAYTTHPTRRSLEGPLSQPFFAALAQAYAAWKLPPLTLADL